MRQRESRLELQLEPSLLISSVGVTPSMQQNNAFLILTLMTCLPIQWSYSHLSNAYLKIYYVLDTFLGHGLHVYP